METQRRWRKKKRGSIATIAEAGEEKRKNFFKKIGERHFCHFTYFLGSCNWASAQSKTPYLMAIIDGGTNGGDDEQGRQWNCEKDKENKKKRGIATVAEVGEEKRKF